jgi:selenide, water dikinase
VFSRYSCSLILLVVAAALQAIMARVCRERGVGVLLGRTVVEVERQGTGGGGALVLADGERVACDECVWCTDAGGAAWLKKTGLSLSDSG